MKLYRLRKIGFIGTDQDYAVLVKRFSVGLDPFLPTKEEWKAGLIRNAELNFYKRRVFRSYMAALDACSNARAYFRYDFKIEEADVIWMSK